MTRPIPVASAWALLLAVCGLAATAGCGVDATRRSSVDARRASRDLAEGASAASGSRAVAAAEEPNSIGVGGHVAATHSMIVYSVRWGRAEDLAQTLDPILKARYGEDARVVPHVPSNKLFLYIPSQRPEDARRARPPASSVR